MDSITSVNTNIWSRVSLLCAMEYILLAFYYTIALKLCA